MKAPRLFLKIFGGFWLICLVIFGSLIGLQFIITSTNDIIPTPLLDDIDRITLALETADIHTDRQLLKTLRNVRRQLPLRQSFRVLIVDDSASLIGKFSPPPEFMSFMHASIGSDTLQKKEDKHLFMIGPQVVNLAYATRYVYFLDHKPKGIKGVMFVLKQYIPLFVLLIISISGVFCYVLARHIVKPVYALIERSQRLAAGDLSARVDAQYLKRRDEFADLCVNFNDMAKSLEQNMDEHKRLLASISHELRSPITRINIAKGLYQRIVADYIVTAPADVQVNIQKWHKQIDDELVALNEMIELLLTYSRKRLMLQQAEKHIFNVHDVLHYLYQNLKIEAHTLDKAFEFESDVASLTLELAVEPTQLKSAFENVMRNALDYAESGVRVSLTRNDTHLLIRVSDDGPGIPESEMDKIFMPFYRVSDSRTRQTGGIGMGLAITQNTIEALGGMIDVETVLPHGVCFKLCIPLYAEK